MNGKQHLLIGATTTIGALWAMDSLNYIELDANSAILATVLGSIGSLAPDIDHPKANISSKIPKQLIKIAIKIVGVLLVLGLGLAIMNQQDLRHAFSDPTIRDVMKLGLFMGFVGVALIVVSKLTSSAFGHRGATHSLIFLLGATAITIYASLFVGGYWWYGLAFGWGWLTHLIADASTEMGLPALLWPLY